MQKKYPPPQHKQSRLLHQRHKGKTLHYTRFVIGRVDTPESVAIDEQLRKIFQKLNQTYSNDFPTPHSSFLGDQINGLHSPHWSIDRLPLIKNYSFGKTKRDNGNT